jgi:hypothetical protein
MIVEIENKGKGYEEWVGKGRGVELRLARDG